LRRKMKAMTKAMPRTSRALAIIDINGRGDLPPGPGGVPVEELPLLWVAGTADGVDVGVWSTLVVVVGTGVAVPVTCGVAVLVGVVPGVSVWPGAIAGVGVGVGV
jgi:hypothetical protein